MAVSFSDLLLSLRADAAATAFVAFDESQTRLRFARVRRARFHLVLEGETTAVLHEHGEATRLRAGDFALFIRGSAHDLGAIDAEPVTLPGDCFVMAEEPQRLQIGQPRTRVLTGYFGLEQMRDEVPTGSISPLVVHSIASQPALAAMFDHAGRENLLALCSGPGGRAFTGSLVRLLYVETMRRTFERISSRDPANFRKLGISQIAAARRLLHADPGQAWTIDAMARSVGMSRSVFARKFHEIVGETPLHYLSGVRFEHASDLIEAGATISEASSHVGYSSPSAFTRAFSRHQGRPPRQALGRRQSTR